MFWSKIANTMVSRHATIASFFCFSVMMAILDQKFYRVNIFIWYADAVSLRERKKAETRQSLWHAAVELFLERGYDNVSIAEIAAAANVSKMTVFNYFSTKDDLVFGPMEEHVEEYATVVRSRAAGERVV